VTKLARWVSERSDCALESGHELVVLDALEGRVERRQRVVAFLADFRLFDDEFRNLQHQASADQDGAVSTVTDNELWTRSIDPDVMVRQDIKYHARISTG
jgi:hypothetical protein